MTEPIKLSSPPWKQELRAAYACGGCNGEGESDDYHVITHEVVGRSACHECDGTGISWQPVELEELTAEAVKAERERCRVVVLQRWTAVATSEWRTVSKTEVLAMLESQMSFMRPPEPLTPKEVITDVVAEMFNKVVTHEEIATAIVEELSGRGFKVVEG